MYFPFPKRVPRLTRELDDRVRELIDQAIQEYKLAESHPRYRLRSQIQMAVLLATKGKNEAALDNLEKFVAGGGATMRGLDQVEQFGSGLGRSESTMLSSDPRFASILDQEMENRIGRGGRRSYQGRSQRERAGHNLPRHSGLSRFAPSLLQPDTDTWNFLKRLNNYLIPYRIKLVNFIRKLLE